MISTYCTPNGSFEDFGENKPIKYYCCSCWICSSIAKICHYQRIFHFPTIQDMWNRIDGNTLVTEFATTFLHLTNDVARGGNPGVMSIFIYGVQQFWIDSCIKRNRENLTAMTCEAAALRNNTCEATSTILLSGGQQSTPCIEFLGGDLRLYCGI